MTALSLQRQANLGHPALTASFHSYMTEIYDSDAVLAGLPDDIEGFQWDAGNSEKNWSRHAVLQAECEQVFMNQPLVIVTDPLHFEGEHRWFALGRTDALRELTSVFTVRGKSIRVISARPMSRQERKRYEEAKAAQS